MREIPLTQGKVAFVDNDDYDYLMQWKWCAHKDGKTFYAVRSSSVINGKRKFIMMHRVIMNTPEGMIVDHIDHDGLNCQKYNMRNCTLKQNTKNRSAFGMSKYLGVTTYRNYIKAAITNDGKYTHLGNFKTKEEAALAYDEAAKKMHGEFANLNFK